MKRSFTQATTQEDFTPEEDMYRTKRNKYNRKNDRIVRSKKVPRALVTRGTPRGYYEIPVTVYRRLYFNSSTGLWNTNPYTAVTSGSNGYNGFALNTAFDTSNMPLGNGTITANVAVAVPGFANVQGVFEEGKIARIHYEFWIAGQSAELGGTLAQYPNFFVVQDNNNSDPPTTLDEVLQYADVRTVGDINRPLKITVYPRVRDSVGSAQDELGTTTTIAQVENAGYYQLSKPGAIHFGLRGWFETNTALAVTQVGYLCIKETQIRRYKITK